MTNVTANAPVEIAELADLMESRAQTYGLLARLFRIEADQTLLEEMRTMQFPSSTGSQLADEGYQLLYGYLKNIWDDSVTELAVDYVRTFVGHGVNAYSAAYPFESVHTSERRLLMQEARDEVLSIYRANNLKKGPAWREGEDHIAIELEFMQVMASRTAEFLRNDAEEEAVDALEVQRDFLKNHLINWVPMLTMDMLKFSQTDFYNGVAKLTLGFIELDNELLDNMIEED